MIMQNNNDSIVLGLLLPDKTLGNNIHWQDYVYSIEGIVRALCSRDYKDPIRVVAIEDDE